MELYFLLVAAVEGKNISFGKSSSALKHPVVKIGIQDEELVFVNLKNWQTEKYLDKFLDEKTIQFAIKDVNQELLVVLVDEKNLTKEIGEIRIPVSDAFLSNTRDQWYSFSKAKGYSDEVQGDIRLLIEVVKFSAPTIDYQGFLHQQEENTTKGHPYYICGSYLFYHQPPKCGGLLCLNGCKVSRSESKDKKKFFIQVKTASNLQLYSCLESTEQTHWVDAIKKAKDQPRTVTFSKMPSEFTEVGKSKKKKTPRDKKSKKSKEKEPIAISEPTSPRSEFASLRLTPRSELTTPRTNENRNETSPGSNKPDEVDIWYIELMAQNFIQKLTSLTLRKATPPVPPEPAFREEKKENDSAQQQQQQHVSKKDAFAVQAIQIDDQVDSPFQGAGQSPGVEIWRIEKMAPVPYPKELHGKFNREDSYIVLKTDQSPDGGTTWNIHYWLGRRTQQDKSASAAIRAVQLNDFLRGNCVHYREVQKHESELFLSYFNYKVKYLKGGVESGFRHVEKGHYEPRLYRIQGDKKLRIHLVETKLDSLDRVSSFVLNTGEKIYIWNAHNTTRLRKTKALEIATKLNSENNGGKGSIIFANENEVEGKNMWEILKGSVDDVPLPSPRVTSSNEEEEEAHDWLYKVQEINEEVTVIPVEEEEYSKTLLDTACCFVLDCETQIFVWWGKNSKYAERKTSIMLAEEFLGMFERPQWAPITRVLESAEPVLFKEKFVDWWDTFVVSAAVSRIAETREQLPINVARLFMNKPPAEPHITVEEGSDCLEVWSVENNTKAMPVPENEIGELISSKSFITLFSWVEPGKDILKSLSFFWDGQNAKAQNYIAYKFGFRDLLEKKMKEEGGEVPIEEKVIQGKESPGFMEAFNRNNVVIIHKDGPSNPSMYHIKQVGRKSTSIKAVQLDEVNHQTKDLITKVTAENLNSGDVFILVNEEQITIWYGTGSNEVEREYGMKVAQRLSQGLAHVADVIEGKEPDTFWTDLGGRKNYASGYLKSKRSLPRLFECSEASGTVQVEEVYRFSQKDLQQRDVMILDAFYEIYVWQGASSSAAEKSMAEIVAKEYSSVASGVDGRPQPIPVTKVLSRKEPLAFRAHFQGWKAQDSLYMDPYDIQKKEREAHLSMEPDSPLLSELKAASTKRASKNLQLSSSS